VAILLAGAYAALPLWAPTGLIRDYLAGAMSAQMGVDVRIEGVSLSWSEGVELRGLHIASPEGFGPEAMVVVPRIRTELAPLDMLLHDRIGWMVLDGPRAFVQVDEAGNVNLAVLKKLRFKAEARRLSVRRAEAAVRLPGHDKLLKVQISDAEYVAGLVRKLGRVTVSAVLDQQGGSAPVSLHLAAGSAEQVIAASALFNFANVDMAQLQLPRLLGLPLERLSGRCRGSLSLQINRQGVVDQFSFNVLIAGLEVQPTAGPELPLIPEAGFRISAVFDPLTGDLEAGRLDIRSASVRLPGLDLAGRASLTTDVLQGRWEAVESLELEGNVYPARLAALLTGTRRVAEGLEVTGPVGLKLLARREKSVVHAKITLDAEQATIVAAGRTIKPAGRPLALSLAGGLDRRNRQLLLDRDGARLTVGGNTFTVTGSLSDVRRLAELRGKDGRPSVKGIIKGLSLLDCAGTFRINDLDSLAELVGPLGVQPGWASLDGRITGRWSVDQFAGTQARLELVVPAETYLSAGPWFVKEAGAAVGAVDLNLSGMAEPEGTGFRAAELALTAGRGRISIYDASLALEDIPGGRGLRAVCRGRFSGTGLEHLYACVPAAGRYGDVAVSGEVAGQYRVVVSDRLETAYLQADLKGLHLTLGRVLDKPAGQAGNLVADLLCDPAAGPAERNALSVTADFEQALIRLSARVGECWPPAGPAKLALDAQVRDAGWLVGACPIVRRRLAGGSMAGPVSLVVAASSRPGKTTFEVNCDADGLEFVLPGPLSRAKAAGTSLRLRLSGAVSGANGRLRQAEIRLAEANLAGSTISLSGRAVLDIQALSKPRRVWPDGWLKEFRAELDVAADIDAPLLAVAPELAGPVRRCGAKGQVVAGLRARGAAEGVSVSAAVDGRRFAIERLGPFAVATGRPGPREAVEIGPFAKPDGMPARVELELSVPSDLSRVQVGNLQVEVADLSVVAEATAQLERRPERSWPGLAKADLHATVRTQRVEALEALAGFLKPYRPGGEFFLDCRLSRYGADAPLLASVDFRTGRLTGRYRGKNVAVAGSLAVREVSFDKAGLLRIGRLRTDSLELQAGDNRCWLIADVAGLPGEATGSFQVLGEYLDGKDLMDWLSPARAGPAGTASRPGSGREGDGPAKLTAGQLKALESRADELVAACRRLLKSARLDGRVSIRRLRTFDPSVGQFYQVNQVELHALADRGRLAAKYAAGLNGGTIRSRYEVNLADAAPNVAYRSAMTDVIAAENIQPQLARYFPGNTVGGLFNRTEESTVPLRNVVANFLDYRYPMRPTGQAKTVTTDGLVEGRAAPRFVTRIFPGLNLAKYHYNKMTSFATFRPDGVAENDMVFSGRIYDMYIEGTTDAQNIGKYEIGLILLGTPQTAEWNHTYRQGRIPILKLKARIEGGKMYDEVVSYPWPNESLFVIFLKNNIFYRLWLAAGRE